MDIWKLIAGVVFFLMGTGFMEDALRNVLSRRFKLFLKKQTSNRIKAVAGGTVLTVFMQSSSVVNMLVLSLVGAGVIQLYQALAVMMGANIGTTFTGWLLVGLGFYFDIKNFAVPLLAVAGVVMMAYPKNKTLYHVAHFFVGFSFLFLGLIYIKEGVEVMVQSTELTHYSHYPLIFFSLLGLALTALVQSSSVTMALVLSVLYHKGIPITSAAALILGAEVGTTLKLGLASIKGLAAKKRVAFGNITFNTLTSVLLFFFIKPIIGVLSTMPGMKDPLVQLVCFQSIVNVIGVVIFLPVLKPFSIFLERRFKQESSMEYLNKIPSNNILMAMDALEKEYFHLLAHTLYFMRSVFQFDRNIPDFKIYPYFEKFPEGIRYEDVKSLYGEVHGYYIRIRQASMTEIEANRIEAIIAGTRNLMYAAKSMKDVVKDLDQLHRSSNEVKYQYYVEIRSESAKFYKEVVDILNMENLPSVFPLLVKLHEHIQDTYSSGIQILYERSRAAQVNATELATLVNVHREMMTSFKSIIFSMKEYYLTGKEAVYFDELPGFIR